MLSLLQIDRIQPGQSLAVLILFEKKVLVHSLCIDVNWMLSVMQKRKEEPVISMHSERETQLSQ